MRRALMTAMFVHVILISGAATAQAANKETIETVAAYVGENGVRVNVFCHNEVGLLEYFNLIIFDDTKLDFVSIEADRGVLWYGAYPTHVDGDHIYVHGVASAPTYCMDPDWGDPGSPLFHINFNVKSGVSAGPAQLNFSSEGVWDGHWNDCSGHQISPNPDYYDGGVDILGHAGHITVGSDSTGPGQQAVVDIYMHNDLDVFEYFNQILFEDAVADVDSIVAERGALHYGNYPTHVSGDTIFVHGWAADDNCFYADHSYPGAALYRIYFTIDESASPGYTMPLSYLPGTLLWNHWVGCDLGTTDSFEATDGWVYVQQLSGVGDRSPISAGILLGQAIPSPTSRGAVIGYYLAQPAEVTLTIYNAAGKKVKTLTERFESTGWHHVVWDGTNSRGQEVASGVYFYCLETASGSMSKKLVVAK